MCGGFFKNFKRTAPMKHRLDPCYYTVLATVPSGEAIALTKPCRCSCKLNRADDLTGIVANVPQLCLVAYYEATQYQFSNNF